MLKKTEENQRDVGRWIWRTGLGQVSREWEKQQSIVRGIEDPSRQQRPEMDKWEKAIIEGGANWFKE